MTIILFLIDTSSSMCQKAYVNGVQRTYLDIAKGAVETFLKYRQRTQDCLGDRYMLLTFEEPPANVKAGWKENHATFMNELKNLQSTGLTSMGESLKNAFDLLNLNRMQSGIDTYGQGRCPFFLEPSVIIVISDGGRYSFRNGVHQEIILPLNTQIPGTKFTKEPFRWDQRLFSLVLRMSGNKIDERVEGKVPHDESPIERMCEVTGGRSYRVRSHYVLNQCLESLVQKVQPGVVLQFEPMMPREEAMQDIVFQPTKKMIFVQKHITQKTFPMGSWPLPEPYWPDPKAVNLPPRDAHPKLKIVTPAVDEPQMVRNFPVDKYEIEASPLTLQILQKREMTKCWQVIISNGMHGFELPFGYLKASPNFSQVHLYVLAYNYPALLPLLHDLTHKYNMVPPNDLMYKFNSYVRSIPPYYCPFLRKALVQISVPYPLLQFLLPENVDNYLSPNIASQLKHIKNTAKQEQDNLCMKVYKQLKQPKPPYRQVETAKLNTGVPLRRDLVRHPLLRDTFSKLHAEIEQLENYTIVVPQLTRQASAKSYRNPFDIPRRDLVEEVARMREAFMRPTPTSLVAKDSGYCLPIAEMGNYQEYLKNKDNPLRELEPTNVRQHMFGNPYKKDRHMVMVDEADLSDVAPMKNTNGGGQQPGGNGNGGGVAGGAPVGMLGGKKFEMVRGRKRKAGPIRKDFIFRRTSVDMQSSSGSSGSGLSSCGSSVAGSSVASLSDFDDNMSDTSSMSGASMSDGEGGAGGGELDRLVVPFDFNEEDVREPEFSPNGYVHNFINGLNDEVQQQQSTSGGDMMNGMPGMHVGMGLPPGTNPVAVGHNPYIAYGPTPQSMEGLNPPAYGHVPVPGANNVNNNGICIGGGMYQQYNGSVGGVMYNTAINVMQQQQQAMVMQMPTAAAPISAVSSMNSAPYHPHTQQHIQNDINDAQEISRILQQCHNGGGGGGGAAFDAATVAAAANAANVLPAEVKTEVDVATMMAAAASVGVPSVTPIGFSTMQPGVVAAAVPGSMAMMATAPAAMMNNIGSLPMMTTANFDSLKQEIEVPTATTAITNHTHSNHINNNNHHQSTTTRNSKHIKTSSSAASSSSSKSSSPTPTVELMSEEQRDAARKHNLEVRNKVFRDIRRPGRDYSQLLENLDLVKGDFDMKSNFIQMCITESMRFRRKQMVISIQDWWEKKLIQLQQQETKTVLINNITQAAVSASATS